MSTAPMLNTFSAANIPAEANQAESIRETMSVNNLLVDGLAAAPDVTSNPPALAAPVTPKRSATMKEETESPDTVMTDSNELDEDPDLNTALDDTAEDVPDAQREFICLNDEHTRCVTGQYTKELSRKVISDHFGRNKACTRDITDWPLFCRKHYQRATYNKAKWQVRKITLINRQFDVIEKEFPGTIYDVALKKSEENRLNKYSRQVASGVDKEKAAEDVAPQPGKAFEAPIDVLRELDMVIGRGKTQEEAKLIVDMILQMLEEQECDQVPSIEFLPRIPGKEKTPSPKKKSPAKRATTPKSPKTPKTPKISKSPKTPTRVSNKGGVKKTLQKA